MAEPTVLSSNDPSSSLSVAVRTWTSIGRRYEDAFAGDLEQLRAVDWAIAQLEPMSTPSHRAKVVDVGCGTGRPVCSRLAAAGFDVRGVDVTPAMIEASRAAVPEAHFEVADSRTWSPSDAPLDGVLAFNSFLSSVTKDDIRAFFPRAASWLRSGGVFVWGTVPGDADCEPIKFMGRDLIVSSLAKDEQLEAIKAAGFAVEHVVEHRFAPKSAGLCGDEEPVEEDHLFVYCHKP